MKKLLFNSASSIVGMIWLLFEHQTFNPISLKGSEFLKFYLIVLLGFYASMIIQKFSGSKIPKSTFYFLIFILFLGVVKLIKGLVLAKPVGYLVMLLITECIMIYGYNLNINNKK
ncbi:hypothetical protein [Chryseobacterium paludis]|uniref:hypothetical protein n=1 Tax=Chryseobacterium paludis TaxID=2956784 RepID=UPI0021BE5931|nr:hypothetical protein [Chryseobacterium paludis]